MISRNTAFTYRNKPVDTRQIGRELGVRYVLEGEVQRSGNRLRVTAQLIDAETDLHLWAERFDGDAGDLFALQDEITHRIAVALDLELVGAEATRPTENQDAQDYIMRGRAARLKPPSRENRAEAVTLFERALALDPESVAAQSWLAIALTARALDFMTDTAAADIARAEDLAERALAASPRSSVARFAKAQVLRAQHRYEEAIPEYETVIALNRNWAHAYSHLGWCKFVTGSTEELIPTQEQAIRLSPRDPQIGLFYFRIGFAHLLQSRTDEAIVWCEKARNATPAHPLFRALLASAYALNGEIERAAAELAEARRLVGDDRYSSIARLRAVVSGVRRRTWSKPRISPVFARPGCRRNKIGAIVDDEGTAARDRIRQCAVNTAPALPLSKRARPARAAASEDNRAGCDLGFECRPQPAWPGPNADPQENFDLLRREPRAPSNIAGFARPSGWSPTRA